MRKYRGKTGTGEWIEGFYIERSGHSIIVVDDWEDHTELDGSPREDMSYEVAIQEDTVQQSTGLKDKNGKEIFEGDVVKVWSQGQCKTLEVRWRQSGNPKYILFPAYNNETKQFWSISATEYKKGGKFIDVEGSISSACVNEYIDDGLEIIGNVIDNPELIK